MKFDYSLIDNIVFDDVYPEDIPDYCDAFISQADYNGVPMTQDQLDFLNEDKDYVINQLLNQLF